MNDDRLVSELHKLQREYKSILERVLIEIERGNSFAIIDEINVFWHRNMKLVNLALENLGLPFSGYLFTGAVILDIADYEHYPFVCLGDYHIWDDPIYTYLSILNKTDNPYFDLKIQKQIRNTIEDSIQILNSTSNEILILPVRLLIAKNYDKICDMAMQAFLSLFGEEMSFENYKKSFSTIEDISKVLPENIKQSISFSNDDDEYDFIDKFNNFKENNVLPIDPDSSDSEIFWFVVYGYMSQALSIILMCLDYSLIPYIRFEVIYRYIIILSANFDSSEEVQNMIFKSSVAHLLYSCFKKEDYRDVSFDNFYNAVRENEFSKNVFTDLNNKNISFQNPKVKDLVAIIQKNLEQLRMTMSQS